MTSAAVAHSQAAGAAAALRSVGIDIDFAPVVDTPGSAGNFLGSRAFSQLPHLERADGEAPSSAACRRTAIAATAKHFPGLGLASGNTDNGRIVIRAAAWKLAPGTAPVPGGGQGRREARDGLDRRLPEARRLEEAGGVLEHDHQRACCGSSSASRA